MISRRVLRFERDLLRSQIWLWGLREAFIYLKECSEITEGRSEISVWVLRSHRGIHKYKGRVLRCQRDLLKFQGWFWDLRGAFWDPIEGTEISEGGFWDIMGASKISVRVLTFQRDLQRSQGGFWDLRGTFWDSREGYGTAGKVLRSQIW